MGNSPLIIFALSVKQEQGHKLSVKDTVLEIYGLLTLHTCGQLGLPHSLRAALGAQAKGESSCLGITEA